MINELLGWTETYIKNRDLTLKKIVNIKIDEKKETIQVKFKDREVTHYIMPDLSEKIFVLEHGTKIIVCLNTINNFDFLIKNWQKTSKIKDMSFIFVNIKQNDKWLINPYVHSLIADPESIETGLKTMFDTANGKIAEVKMEKKKPKMFDEDVADKDDSEE
ncbi:MAG: hypothetical protein ACP5NV_01750 [Candidatus Woesearchaeota archaeon]